MGLIALGVCGGIGAYKAVEVARGLQDTGHEVVTLMTASARQFVGPLTFEAITRRRVITDQFAPGTTPHIEHVSIASKIDALVVAPATANCIGKLANGIADDFLTSLYLATRAPVVIAPAMNSNMFAHEAVSRNLETLRARGVRIVGPGEGYLACGWIGKGRLAEPADVVSATQAAIRPPGDLTGRTVLVTAGPTYEDVDPVRYVGNRSSGRMGLAVAEEAVARGARVVLVVGPTALAPPVDAEVIHVRSADDMRDSVLAHVDSADAVIMAAAVADYTLREGRRNQKLAKDSDGLILELVRTTDILWQLGRWRGDRSHPLLVGFAAETHDVLARARAKLEAKQVDLIVANDVSRSDAGFEVTTNVATLIDHAGHEAQPLQSKRALASVILDRVERRLGNSSGSAKQIDEPA